MTDQSEEGVHIEPNFLVDSVLRFKCFEDAKAVTDRDQLFNIIMDSYSEDNLTEAQDLVVEFIIHLFSPETPFNLNQAIKVWDKEDIDVFSEIIKEQV